MEDCLISVKVDPDFKRGGEAAGGGVGRAWRRGCPEGAADPWHPSDGGGGGGRSLQGGDLEIISQTDLACLSGAEGGHPGALRSDIGFLRGVIRRDSDTIRGRGGGVWYDRAVADRAVAPGPPEADVIILVTQMGLGCGDGSGSSVPVKASNLSFC